MVSLEGKRLVGFGRATSDGFSRAVLWDIVVAGDLQGHGLGRWVIEEYSTPRRWWAGTGVPDDHKECRFTGKGFQDATRQQLMALRR